MYSRSLLLCTRSGLKSIRGFSVSKPAMVVEQLKEKEVSDRAGSCVVGEETSSVQRDTPTATTAAPKQSFFQMIKSKGPAFLIYYGVIYWSGFAGCYGLLDFNVVSYQSVVSSLQSVGIDRLVDLSSLDPVKGKAGVAFVMNEIMEPIRIGLTVGTLDQAVGAFNKIKGMARGGDK